MAIPNHPQLRKARGFTLPAILVVVSALLILAVGALLVVGIERNTSRAFSDRERANLAARAGLEDVKGILTKEAANDDFIILHGPETKATGAAKDPALYLYLARGSGGGDKVAYRYVPLFSAETIPSPPDAGSPVKAPEAKDLIGSSPEELTTLPWFDPAKVSWITIPDSKGKIVSRYAYWVEDLQGKLDPKIAGNEGGPAGVHQRAAFPDPSSKPLGTDKPPLNAIALHVLDPNSGDIPTGDLTGKVINGRNSMISPDSVLGATAFELPLPRSTVTGLLANPLAASLERHTSPVLQTYREQPVVPFAQGISQETAGKPKLNLNKLLNDPREAAIDEFAAWVEKALPNFATPSITDPPRQGGFPDDYLKTLAANAFDYADSDNDASVKAGSYRGLDVYPLLSEVVLKIEYLGHSIKTGKLFLKFRFKLFGEFWNMTNKPVEGKASLSYEVALNPTQIETYPRSGPFDDPALLLDKVRTQSNLTFRNGRFFGPDIDIKLAPDEYKFYQFADVTSSIAVGPSSINWSRTFELLEYVSEQRGVSVLWDGVETERIDKIVRDLGDPNKKEMQFTILYPKSASKAAIPGFVYGPYGDFRNNMGDPRISHYMRSWPAGGNDVTNMSPNRRNIRRGNIYDNDPTGMAKRRHFGRVLPSEWPDGGHNSEIGSFTVPPNTSLATEPIAASYLPRPTPLAENSPMRISNAGRFYSSAELGNVYDPVMWYPTYSDLPNSPGSGASDTATLSAAKNAMMPASRNVWPDVSEKSTESNEYGGGNTLRIGRPEHEKFDMPGKHAAHLLDLFHVGDADTPLEEGAESTTVSISGHINVNTAEKDTLRAMAAGLLKQDPELRRVSSWDHEVSNGKCSPKTAVLELGSPTLEKAADRIADGIINSRPFASFKELAGAKVKPTNTSNPDEPVFGNKLMYSEADRIQWTDSAAEEIFARVHDASTLRSRNFRVWVVGQSVNKVGSTFEVLAESKKVFNVFADPGERKPDGSIDPLKTKPTVTYENDF